MRTKRGVAVALHILPDEERLGYAAPLHGACSECGTRARPLVPVVVGQPYVEHEVRMCEPCAALRALSGPALEPTPYFPAGTFTVNFHGFRVLQPR